VLVLLTIFGLSFIYLETRDTSYNSNPSQNPELSQLNNTLAAMYKAESAMGMFSVSYNDSIKAEYDNLIRLAQLQIDTLQDVVNNVDIILKLNELSLLLMAKQHNMTALVKFTHTLNDNISGRVRETIINYRNISDKQLVNRIHTRTDTTYSAPKQRGILRRLADVFSSKQDSVMTVSVVSDNYIDSVIPVLMKDTIVSNEKIISKLTQTQSEKIYNEIIIRRLELAQISDMITANINSIMNEVHEYEVQRRLAIIRAKSDSLTKVAVYEAIIGSLAIAIAIFFIVWTIIALNAEARLTRDIKKAKQRVEDLLKSREQLIYTVTHDIKAPISSIIGFLYLMDKDKATPSKKQRYYIENMSSSAEHILELVKNLLDFHSLENNKHTVNKIPFSPKALLEDIYESFIPLAANKNIEYKFSSTIENKEFISDPFIIRQILNNLISNAIKYTPQAGVVSIFAKIDEKFSLIVSVKDTGAGISKEDLKRIFEEFTRLDETREMHDGSGLGLSISQKFAKLLGGKIQVVSEKGKGSDFTFELSLDNIDTEYIALSESSKILFIDDDHIQLNLITEYMNRLKIAHTCCDNSSDAIKALNNSDFSMIFTDVNLKEIKGSELVGVIRNLSFKNAATIPIIGFSAAEIVDENSVFTDYLQKPFHIEQLIKIIKRYGGDKFTELPENLHENALEYLNPEDDEELYQKVSDSFINETSANIKQLDSAWENGDVDTVKYLAHKMLTLMKMISADKIVEVLLEMEGGNINEENKSLLIRLLQEKIDEMKEKRSKHENLSIK
jgi:signal transduction histidine kinase/CheY-like chemotaxis protein